MKNILYIGPYRQAEFDGWANSSREYLEALLLTGHNISAKPVYMANNSTNKISDRILHAEQISFKSQPDIIIQHVLPDLFEWHEGYNIGIFDTETKYLNSSPWIDKINLLDQVWVDSPSEVSNLKNSGVKIRVENVPTPTNTEYISQFVNVPTLDIPQLDGKFIFYFIGEHTERKNIMAFIKAFHREFEPEENVAIVIKTGDERLKDEINEWKRYSRTRRNYIPEVLITGRISEETIFQIHQTGNCFVCTSRGESMCLPMVHAIYFGNLSICTSGIFASSLFKDGGLAPVDSNEIPVDCKNPPLPHIYTGKEMWDEIDIKDLQKTMREVFLNVDKRKNKNYRKIIERDFSRSAVAERMKQCLLLET